MDSSHQINVPLRSGGKKMRKRRELDALIAHSLTKKSNCRSSNSNAYSQDRLLSVSTDDAEEYSWARSKVAHNNNRSHKHTYMILRLCKPLLYVAIVTLLSGLLYWLYLDLRQQIYVYRQKTEEVSAKSHNLPDALQKWHEMSTSLLKNQTVLHVKIGDLQRTVEALRYNFTNYKASIDPQQNYAKDEKLVADFGAKIEAVVTDIDSIKDHYNTVVSKQNILQSNILQLKLNLKDIKKVASEAMELPSNYSDEIKSFKSSILVEVTNLQMAFNVINDTFSQRSDIVHKEVAEHKTKLDELFDRFENITSHVTSIENNWPEYRQKISEYEKNTNHLESDIMKLKMKFQKFDYSVEHMCNTCQTLYIETMQDHFKKSVIPQTSVLTKQLLNTSTVNEVVTIKSEEGSIIKPN